MDNMDEQNNLQGKQNNEDDLQQIIDGQHKKLRQLDKATQLIKCKANVKDELQRMHNELSQVSHGVQNLRSVLDKLREQNLRCRELSSLLEALDRKIVYLSENVPQELVQSYKNAEITARSKQQYEDCSVKVTHFAEESAQKTPGGTYRKLIEKQERMKVCKRTLFNEPEVCQTISFITAEEFNKVPKYIIGRQTLDTINTLISAINQTLIAKYTLLSLGKTAAQKRGEISLYSHYKQQEFDIRKKTENPGCLYFFTAEDYHRQTGNKLDKTKLNLMTAMRHCKRLRECRIKNELYYVVTPH